jgi:hypothetical protein
MAKKKGKSKMSVSVKKSSKQKKGQQKQSQSLSVTVNLGKKGGGRQSKPQIPKIPSFPPNYPPFFNQYNQQPNNWFNPPPPIPQKQYAVFPESEKAPMVGLLSSVSVPLRVEGNPLKEKEPNLAKVASIDENILKPAPVEDNPFVAAQFITSLDEPTISAEEEELSRLAEEERQREEELSRLAEEERQKRTTLNDLLAQQAKPQPKVRKGKSEQQKAEEARQQEEIIQMTKEEKQQKAEEKKQRKAEEKAKPLKEKSLARFIESGAESLPLPIETKKKGAPVGPRKQTYETIPPKGYAQFPVPVKETLGISIPAELTAQGAFNLYAPLGEQPSAQLQPKIIFAAQPAAEEPAKEKGETLQRQRRVIERAEAPARFLS